MRAYSFFTGWHEFEFTSQDILLGLMVFIFILVTGFINGTRKSEGNPIYKYYFRGLLIKMIGSLAFALVYTLYYEEGGDTIAYFYGAESLKNLFYKDPSAYFYEMFHEPSRESFFNNYDTATGWPPEWLYRSSRHYFVCKLTSIITIFLPNSFLATTFVLGWISYKAIWRLFLTMSHNFPELTSKFQMALLFLPSTLFWCSGIMKDTIVLASVCWIVHETDKFLRPESSKKYLRFTLITLLCGWLIFSCKSYILIALVPAWLLWMNYNRLKKIKGTILKYIILPTLFLVGFIVVFQIYATTTKEGEYSPENVIDKAIVVRNDFNTNQTYGNNRFKAQAVENSTVGLISAIPEAIMTGLFRPFIWEARSPFILISAAENLVILYFFLYAVIKLRIKGFIKFIRSHPIIIFSIFFAIVLGYIVGFTSIIFGALVRFKTAFLPFFASFIIIAVGQAKSTSRTYLSNFKLNLKDHSKLNH